MKKQLLVDLCKFVGVNPGNLNKKELEELLEDKLYKKPGEQVGIRSKVRELIAKMFEEHDGHTILDKDYNCFAGSVDIVTVCDHVIHFINVSICDADTGFYEEPAVTPQIRKRLESIAGCYLGQSSIKEVGYTFHSVQVKLTYDDRIEVRIYRNILSASE